jgi:hypothetical protein
MQRIGPSRVMIRNNAMVWRLAISPMDEMPTFVQWTGIGKRCGVSKEVCEGGRDG